MEPDNGKIRARLKDGQINVKVLIRHPMETGRRTDPASGELIPRHYIREVICEHNGKVVMTLDWSWGVSADPYLAFQIRNGQLGDSVSVRWTDDRDQAGTLTTEAT
jgi:sulfur-oxidizing protein SoxZ